MKKLRIIVDINHPGHVHFFKYFIWEMKKRGHEILITASKKDIAFELLDKYDFKYVNLGSYGQNLIQKIFNLFLLDYKMFLVAKKFKPDLFLGIASIRSAHVSYLLGLKCFIFDDTERAPEINLYKGSATSLVNPNCFKISLGQKQIYYHGYHELAYLHPNYFKPDHKILKQLKISKNTNFFVLRFVSWQAGHDFRGKGFTDAGRRKLIKELSKYGQVIITSELDLPADLKKYQIQISPDRIHDLLYYATMYIGEGATMASEAAILGTPAIFVSSLSAGTLEEQEKKYELLYGFKDESEALIKIKQLLKNRNLKADWHKKRDVMLQDKIDVTSLMIDLCNRSLPASKITNISDQFSIDTLEDAKKNKQALARNIGSFFLLIVLVSLSYFYIKKNLILFNDWKHLNIFYLSILIVLNYIFVVIQGLVLKAILKPYKIFLEFKEWFGLTVATLMFNYLFPFGGLGFRAAYLKRRYNFDYTYFVSTLAAITLVEFLMLTLGGLITLVSWYFSHGTINWLIAILLVCVAIFCLSIVFFTIKLPTTKYKILEFIKRVVNSWYELRKNKELLTELIRLIFWQSIISAVIYFMAFRTFNFYISFTDSFLPACLSSYSLFIRILPASFGAYEGAVVMAAKFLGYSVAQGLLVSGLSRLSIMVWVFTLGPIFTFMLMRRNKERRV